MYAVWKTNNEIPQYSLYCYDNGKITIFADTIQKSFQSPLFNFYVQKLTLDKLLKHFDAIIVVAHVNSFEDMKQKYPEHII